MNVGTVDLDCLWRFIFTALHHILPRSGTYNKEYDKQAHALETAVTVQQMELYTSALLFNVCLSQTQSDFSVQS